MAERIPALDGWRGISISLVVAGHLWIYGFSHHFKAHINLAGEIATLGVYIFFFISGLIITRLSLQEIENTGRFSIVNFYKRRFFRIVPPFFVYLAAVLVALNLGWIDQPAEGIAWSGAFLCNIVNDCGWFVAHSWSLAYEEQFYLIFPAALTLSGRKIGVVTGAALAVLLVLPVARVLLPFDEEARAIISFSVPFTFICTGCLVARYWTPMTSLAVTSAGRALFFASALLIAVVVIGRTVSLPPGSFAARSLFLVGHIGLPLAVGYVVFASLHGQAVLHAMLISRPLLWLGGISYSLYLWQQMFLGPRSLYLGSSILLIYPAMLIPAWVSRVWVEKPSIRIGHKSTRKKERATLQV